MKKYYLYIICTLILLSSTCTDRRKQNPFEPGGKAPLNLDIIAYSNNITLSWSKPSLEIFFGFNIYRSETGETGSFTLIAENLLPTKRSFIDGDIIPQKRFYYYITVIGQDIESNPSLTVSAVPGPGYNWIVDWYGYEVLKLTYDLQKVLVRFYTNWPPEDIAVAKDFGTGLILYPSAGMIEKISLESGERQHLIESVDHPYAIEYDATGELFWIIDSSGYLYEMDPQSVTPNVVSAAFKKPISLHIAENNGYIYVTDAGLEKIFQLDRAGEIIAEISTINNQSLQNPIQFLHNEPYKQYWLLESTGRFTYINTKSDSDSDFVRTDTTNSASDMEYAVRDNSIYLAEFNGINSSVLQLYPDGARQISVTGFYNPVDIEINKYDATLLVADTGYGIIWHFDREHNRIGSFHNLGTPIKVIVE
jgi:hypothetical protein